MYSSGIVNDALNVDSDGGLNLSWTDSCCTPLSKGFANQTSNTSTGKAKVTITLQTEEYLELLQELDKNQTLFTRDVEIGVIAIQGVVESEQSAAVKLSLLKYY